mmetsp:Transcript_24800/g.68088  ORF Transcript_24800/g.68088 Transcript_24800/m.68088 type:complete len:147 (-) Transcript_24800:354-794(-)|eukprot:scaffold23611_cov37-Tisochrysis_lutea.AAC.1
MELPIDHPARGAQALAFAKEASGATTSRTSRPLYAGDKHWVEERDVQTVWEAQASCDTSLLRPDALSEAKTGTRSSHEWGPVRLPTRERGREWSLRSSDDSTERSALLGGFGHKASERGRRKQAMSKAERKGWHANSELRPLVNDT